MNGIDARPIAIALMGPTASGKTALAIEWSRRYAMQVISVDSALVYRGLEIGSAKPDAATLALTPHRLIDLRDPHETYSAADFARDARSAMQEITADGAVPLLVGGTGLYFRALLDGLSEMPESEPELRTVIEAEAEQRGWASLHADLARIDPEAGTRIHPNDPQRITRALEVWRSTGVPITAWQVRAARRPFPWRVLRLVIAPRDRGLLHDRIAARFDSMLASGLIEEVQSLRRDPRLHRDQPAMRAVGYRQTWEFLERGESLSWLREQGIAATRQLAKRQLTWFRRGVDLRWLDPESQRVELAHAVEQFLAR